MKKEVYLINWIRGKHAFHQNNIILRIVHGHLKLANNFYTVASDGNVDQAVKMLKAVNMNTYQHYLEIHRKSSFIFTVFSIESEMEKAK